MMIECVTKERQLAVGLLKREFVYMKVCQGVHSGRSLTRLFAYPVFATRLLYPRFLRYANVCYFSGKPGIKEYWSNYD